MNRRRAVLFMLLALTVSATVWVSQSDDNADITVPAVERAKPNKKPVVAQNPKQLLLALDKLERQPMVVGDLNPFQMKSWYVAPPPPPPSPPPPPTAPPLPFVYQGKLDEGAGRWVIYLVKGEQLFSVRKGETFDTHYRLNGIDKGSLVIEYLPMAIKQTLPIGSEF